jgi:hypothetical protein
MSGCSGRGCIGAIAYITTATKEKTSTARSRDERQRGSFPWLMMGWNRNSDSAGMSIVGGFIVLIVRWW